MGIDLASLNLLASSPAKSSHIAAPDLESVAAYIREKQPRIVVMAGAGVSTAAGIPDFRTPGTGLYDNLKKVASPLTVSPRLR